MKSKLILLISICFYVSPLKAQSIDKPERVYNIYDDIRQINSLRKDNKPFGKDAREFTLKVISKYFDLQSDRTEETFKALQLNPIAKELAEKIGTNEKIKADTSIDDPSTDNKAKPGGTPLVLGNVSANTKNNDNISKFSGPGFNGSAIFDGLTQVIIERAKEELTATFFEMLKRTLKDNPELIITFPKTNQILNKIEIYLFATYLNSLREAFFSDINDLPFQIGNILQSPKIKIYIEKNPKLNMVWSIIPAFKCLNGLKNGKSIADAVRELNPEEDLFNKNKEVYTFLKLIIFFSESVRDSSGEKDWVSNENIKLFFQDSTNLDLYLILLNQELNFLPITSISNSIINNQNRDLIKTIVSKFVEGYSETNSLYKFYKDIKDTVDNGGNVTYEQIIRLTISLNESVNTTWKDIKPLNRGLFKTAVVDSIFSDFPKIIEILNNYKHRKYSLGLMNTVILLDQYIANKTILKPFIAEKSIITYTNNPDGIKKWKESAIQRLSSFNQGRSDKKIASFIKKVNECASDEKTVKKLIKKIGKYSYDSSETTFDGYLLLQKILKYGTFMANLSEAATPDQIKTVINSAILPVGSSVLKYHSSYSVSINSYIGAAVYHSNYNRFATSEKLDFNTIGVSLPIGLNVSKSIRGNFVGAISVFSSIIDLGAVASYRLSNPPESNTQSLPAFTVQNIIAPGGFLVFNRLFKTPLAVGIGAQRAPQLEKVTNGSTDLTLDPKWRVGVFVSFDIPLLNLYSKTSK